MIRSHLVKFFLIGALILSTHSLIAQPGAPPPDPGDPVPITGIEILIGVGALYGSKRLIENRKTKN
jgi:hypothetical protein